MTTWNNIAGPSTSWTDLINTDEFVRYLQAEDGTYLLTETGDYIEIDGYSIGALGWGDLTGPSTSWTNVT